MSDNLPTTPDDAEAGPTSMVLVKVGGRVVDAKTASGCRTCQSPHRAKIESWLLEGFSRPTILAWLEGLETGPLGHPTDKSIRLHVKKHMPMDAVARAAIINRRAEQLGDEVEKYGGRVIDHITALDTVVALGFDALAKGELRVDAPTLMKAIDLKHKIDSSMEDGGVDANVWRDALMEYMRIAMQFIPAVKREEFSRALSTSPILAALSKNSQTRQN
jgi:hypothetical protein